MIKSLIVRVFVVLILVLGGVACKSAAETKTYEVEPVSTGSQGNYLIKVWSYSKKANVAIEEAKRNAVHTVIFRGFAGKQGVPGQKPLASSPSIEQENKAYFDEFFKDGGKYLNYVSISGDGVVRAEDRLRVGKLYKVGVIVSVNVAQLRKELEKDKIIKPLGGIF